MENRNQYSSPRDRIDDALLIRLLNEEEPASGYTPGGWSPSCREKARCRSTGNNSRNTGRNEHMGTGCSCENRNERTGDCEERNEPVGCGCEERNERAGCGFETQNEQICSRCGESRNRCRCQDNGCRESCARGGCLSAYPLAMVYMPDHDWDNMFNEEEALSHGTLFRKLELPFYPGKCGRGCR